MVNQEMFFEIVDDLGPVQYSGFHTMTERTLVHFKKQQDTGLVSLFGDFQFFGEIAQTLIKETRLCGRCSC